MPIVLLVFGTISELLLLWRIEGKIHALLLTVMYCQSTTIIFVSTINLFTPYLWLHMIINLTCSWFKLHMELHVLRNLYFYEMAHFRWFFSMLVLPAATCAKFLYIIYSAYYQHPCSQEAPPTQTRKRTQTNHTQIEKHSSMQAHTEDNLSAHWLLVKFTLSLNSGITGSFTGILPF